MTVNDIITLPVSQGVINKTATNTIRKVSHTLRTLMYGRTPVELLDNIFMGDMAKNTLLEYLRPHCTRQIIDYDEIRTDNFTEADPGWDFKVGNNLIKVEVKSSTPPNGESRADIIAKRDIKITASHDKGATWIQPDALESYIHIQIYFEARPYRNGPATLQELQNALVADPSCIHQLINSPKYNHPLFFGWDTKDRIIQYVATLRPNTWTWPKASRIYWRCPISNAYTMPQLIEYINSH